MTDSLDRRVSSRWIAVRNTATVEFEAEAGIRRVRARLIDISRDGALVATEESAAPQGLLWIRIDDPAKTDWIGAITVRRDSAHQVGLRFLGPCPDDFLLAAMIGIDLGPTILEGGRPLSHDDVVVGV